MGRDSSSKTFATKRGPVEFSVTQLGASDSAKLFLRMGRLVGPAFARAAGAAGGGNPETPDVSAADLSAATADLFERLNDGELDHFLQKLIYGGTTANIEGSYVPVNKQLLDELFRGQVEGLFGLVQFALEVNYADFFSGLASKVKAAMAKFKVPKSPATTISSGPLSA